MGRAAGGSRYAVEGQYQQSMGTLDFIAALVGDLAWPLTVALALLLFRGPITNLLPFLQRLRYKDFVVEFGDKLTEVETQAASMAGDRLEVLVREDILDLAETYPRAAVIDSWLAVEQALRDLRALQASSADDPQRVSPLALERELARSGVLGPAVVSLLRDLRLTRNDVVHRLDVPLTPAMARQFAIAASRVVAVLESLGESPD